MESKKIKAKKSGCPNCGATMKYSPEKQKLFCEACETTKDILFLPITQKRLWKNKDKGSKSTKEWASENKALKCLNCGASIILNKLEYAKKCPYCQSALVGDSSELKSIAPDGIIPFKLSAGEASKKYVEGVKKKFFVPRAFKKNLPVENIKGIYVPCFSFDAKGASKYKGRLAKKNHDDITVYRNISGTYNFDYTDIVVESSSKINQVQMSEILPYNMKNVVEFDEGFIMGYTIEQYETTVEECHIISKRIMEETSKRTILRKYTYDRVVSFDLESTYLEEKYLYYLLPVYKCDFTYKKKNYTTFMNGQSGKVGEGFPVSIPKAVSVILLVLLIIGGIFGLVLSL